MDRIRNAKEKTYKQKELSADFAFFLFPLRPFGVPYPVHKVFSNNSRPGGPTDLSRARKGLSLPTSLSVPEPNGLRFESPGQSDPLGSRRPG